MIKKMLKMTSMGLLVSLNCSTSFGMEHPQEELNFLSLPSEMQLAVLSHLEAKDLINASMVNKGLHEVCQDEALWESLYKEKEEEKITEQATWKQNFIDSCTQLSEKSFRFSLYLGPKEMQPGCSKLRLPKNFRYIGEIEVWIGDTLYKVYPNQAGNDGRISIDENLVLKRKDVIAGTSISYSLIQSKYEPIENLMAGRTTYYGDVEKRDAGTVGRGHPAKYMFHNSFASGGRNYHIAGIRLDLSTFNKGVIHYRAEEVNKY